MPLSIPENISLERDIAKTAMPFSLIVIRRMQSMVLFSRRKTYLALLLIFCVCGLFFLYYGRYDIARLRVDYSWRLNGKPLPPTNKSLDGTYLPARQGSAFGGSKGFAIRGNKIIYETWSDVVGIKEMPGEYKLELIENYNSGESNRSLFRAPIALVVRSDDLNTFLIHPRETANHQFLVWPSNLAPYTIASLIDEKERYSLCFIYADFIKVSDTPSNEFNKFELPKNYNCFEPKHGDMSSASPIAHEVLNIVFQLLF